MAAKKMNASTGYFTKEMQAILKKGEAKASTKKPAAKKTNKK